MKNQKLVDSLDAAIAHYSTGVRIASENGIDASGYEQVIASYQKLREVA